MDVIKTNSKIQMLKTQIGIWALVFGLFLLRANAQQVQGYPILQVPNSSSGTGQYLLTKVDNTAGGFKALTATTADTSGVLGIAVANVGTTGNVSIQVGGLALCNFDGPTTAGDYVQISTGAAGYCNDAGTSYPTNQVIGRVRTTNPGSGTFQVELFTPSELRGPATFIAAFLAQLANPAVLTLGTKGAVSPMFAADTPLGNAPNPNLLKLCNPVMRVWCYTRTF